MKTNSTTSGRPRKLRGWIPGLILAVAAANFVRLQYYTDLDSMTKNFQTFLTGVGTLGLLLLWWLLLSGRRWRTRLAGLGVVVLVAVGLRYTVRIDGSMNGTGRPKFAWRWAPRKTGEIGAVKVAPAKAEIKALMDYPGYLGPDRSGVVNGVKLESDWKAHPPQEVWRRPIGLGWSGFAVAGPRAITQEQRGENELVVCYDLSSGRELWSHTNHVRFSEPMGGDGPRATPTIDGARVYALGGTGILDCLETASGKLIWTHDTLKENGLPNTYFGKCSSPLLADGLVVVSGGMTNQSSLLAFRRADGALAWRAGKDEASFCSPDLVTLAGVRQILSVNAATVTGHDLKDGHVLWEYAWANNKWPKCAQPVILGHDQVLLTASFNAGCVLLQVTAKGPGALEVKEVWKNRNLKSEFSNVVTRDGFIYGLDDGILECLDAATGARKWKEGRYGHGQLLLINDKLLVQTERGPVALVDANPAGYQEEARFDALKDKTWNTPALAGQFLLVRNDQEAACYRLRVRGN